jgi:hypothetical protein
MKNHKYNKNHNYFKQWSNEMAYVLGFFCADGHLATSQNVIYIQLHRKDDHILKNFIKFFNYEGPLHYRQNSNTVQFSISSEEITKDLVNFGLTRHKSQELKWVEQIPEQFIPHFVRGYFDGDGHIGLAQAHNPNDKKLIVKLVSTLPFIQRLKSEFEKYYGSECGSIKDNKTYFELVYTGSNHTNSFLDWIYKDSTDETRLKRKYEIYSNFINKEDYLEQTVKIDFDLAEKIRNDFKNGLNTNELSLKYNVNRCSIKPIVDNITHTKEDNRDVRSKLYVEAWGETKHYLDWLKDERCLVDKNTLYDRLFRRNAPPEIAMTIQPDKGKTSWVNPDSKKKTHLFEYEGEEKSILAWSKDERCNFNYQKLKYRLLKLGMNLGEALKES